MQSTVCVFQLNSGLCNSFNAMLELLPMAKSQLSELFVHIELHSELWVFCAAFDERVGVCDQFVQC